MPRATQLIPASERQQSGRVIDTLILPFAQRQGLKGFLFGSRGTCVELDLAEPKRLRTDDVLVLDDGNLIEVVAEPEPVLELRAPDLPSLAKLAWHLGDRHIPVQILERRLRLRADPQVEEMLARWGVKATGIEAPFEPEGGAYEAAAAHDHAHHDHAHHDHAHHDHSHHHHGDHHHEHGHDHGHHHDHATHDHEHQAHTGHAHHDHGHTHAHAGDCGCGHDHGSATHQHADEKR